MPVCKYGRNREQDMELYRQAVWTCYALQKSGGSVKKGLTYYFTSSYNIIVVNELYRMNVKEGCP